jgi:hypothetical protein
VLARAVRGMPWLALCASISGCGLDSNVGDLANTLLDPPVQGFDVPGQRLLEGPHYDLDIQADEAGARFALARDADTELAIIDFETETHCRVGRVARYGNALLAPRKPALIPLLVEDGSGGLRLAFSTFRCERSSFELATAGLPETNVEGVDTGTGVGVIVKTPEGGLSLVDPWSETAKPLAESVRNADPIQAFDVFWWVDRGVITISDPSLEPLAYYGENVAEFTVSPEDPELAYVEAGEQPGQGGTLYTVDASSLDTPREIASEACGVRYLTVEQRRKRVYFSPCAERRLVLQDREDDSIRVIADDVASPPVIRAVGGEDVLAFITTPDTASSSGTLWIVRRGSDPVAIVENVRVNQPPGSLRGGLLALVDWSDNRGRLVQWKDGALTDVAADVAEIGPIGRLENDDLTLLANFDGTTGDLVALSADLSTTMVASGVPRDAAEGDAFIANFDGYAGDLHLFDRSSGSSSLLATAIGKGSFRFAVQFNGIMMLSDRKREDNTTTLRVHLLDSVQDYVFHDGVTEAREVAFPSSGLLYNVVVGDEAGVWFSKTL